MSGPGIPADFSKPSAPRIYDYLLGGKDNFAPDRARAEEMIGMHPGLRNLAKANRRFVLAATTWCASAGIGQFIDLGCGLPCSPMVHETARDVNPDARVAYIDRDLIVLSHMRALAEGPGVAVIEADAGDPEAVLNDAGLLRVINPARPAGVLLGGTLSHMSADAAREAVAGYAWALAPGSCVAISCASYADEEFGQRIGDLFGCGWRNHSREDVISFFIAGGLRLLRGGDVDDVSCWPMESSCKRRTAAMTGGVGVKDRA